MRVKALRKEMVQYESKCALKVRSKKILRGARTSYSRRWESWRKTRKGKRKIQDRKDKQNLYKEVKMDKNNKIFKVFLVLLVSFSIVFVSLSPSLANNTENLGYPVHIKDQVPIN